MVLYVELLQYSWNIAERGVKHHKLNQTNYMWNRRCYSFLNTYTTSLSIFVRTEDVSSFLTIYGFTLSLCWNLFFELLLCTIIYDFIYRIIQLLEYPFRLFLLCVRFNKQFGIYIRKYMCNFRIFLTRLQCVIDIWFLWALVHGISNLPLYFLFTSKYHR
jgi:hypothetical protein